MKTMANKYYNVDKSPYHTNCYFIHASEEVHKCFLEAPKNNPFSYQMIIIGLFGLGPSDFFKYIQVKYNAKILKKEKSIWKTITFSNLADANAFAKECDRRFDYCVKNKFFEVNYAG